MGRKKQTCREQNHSNVFAKGSTDKGFVHMPQICGKLAASEIGTKKAAKKRLKILKRDIRIARLFLKNHTTHLANMKDERFVLKKKLCYLE